MRTITFTTHEIAALQNKRKTQFREPLKQQPIRHQVSKPLPIADYIALLTDARKKGYETLSISGSSKGLFLPACPYGKVGDALNVIEEISQNPTRFYLKIKDIRIERLHELTAQDAHAEGASNGATIAGLGNVEAIEMLDLANNKFKRLANFKVGYYHMFTQKYGAQRWDDNPWVWVISFEQCQKPRKVNRVRKQVAKSQVL